MSLLVLLSFKSFYTIQAFNKLEKDIINITIALFSIIWMTMYYFIFMSLLDLIKNTRIRYNEDQETNGVNDKNDNSKIKIPKNPLSSPLMKLKILGCQVNSM